MVIPMIRRLSAGVFPIISLSALLIVSLYLLSASAENSEQFAGLYFKLLVVNLIGLAALIVLIVINFSRLIKQYRHQATGSKITVKLMFMFVVLSLTPVFVVYYFSLGFIQSGVDSWFDVPVDNALEDALELSRLSLNSQKAEYLKIVKGMKPSFSLLSDNEAKIKLSDLSAQFKPHELTLFSLDGDIIGTQTESQLFNVPLSPSVAIIHQLRSGLDYVDINTLSEKEMYVRVLMLVGGDSHLAEPRILQTLFPLAGQTLALAENVNNARNRYHELTVLRGPLKTSFTITLSLVLLLVVLTAIWAAFFSARRLVAPIRALAVGTKAVSAGDYNKQLPMHASDELGFLVQSFNDMTKKIAKARDDLEYSRQQTDAERAYLRAVLGHLSSGVLTLDRHQVVRSANLSVYQILGTDLKSYVGKSLEDINQHSPFLQNLVSAIQPHLHEKDSVWKEEVHLLGARGRQVLMCGGAALKRTGNMKPGHVVVIDDVTALLQAQRDAAWGEVARRLAHEIKNPLTPIQLSAERLRHKYIGTMKEKDAEFLNRSTHTIVQQVEVMKEMVKAFSEYARSPKLNIKKAAINKIISEVLDLYRGSDSEIKINFKADENLPQVDVDSGRIRQLMHNLIKNATEASDKDTLCVLSINVRNLEELGQSAVEISVKDNGPGVSEDLLTHFFEPYVTTKPKGSGLGLAVVNKIVEEHNGVIWADNLAQGGIEIVIRLSVDYVADYQDKAANMN